jgi:hypothetical protein
MVKFGFLGDELKMYQKGPSVLKNSLVPFSEPRSGAQNPGFVVFWSCFGLPTGSTATFSTAWVVFDTWQSGF